jgi:hypothetical protein
MPHEIEWQLWRQLKGAFLVDYFHMVPVVEGFERGNLFQHDTMEEALAATAGDRAFLEPTGYNPMGDLPQGDIVLVIGNTDHSNIEHANVNETYRIHTPGRTVLYGSDAAAIALAIRYGQ